MEQTILDRKVNLGFFPTPIHELKNLSALFPGCRIFIKRDDQTGLATGGNKTRKLEYLIREALERGCDTLITAGAQQSNHCRQTAAACAAVGLECHLLLGGAEPDRYSGNLLLSSLLGAQIRFTGEHRKGEDIPDLRESLEKKGRHSFVIPYGGSNLTGALGFVHAVQELKSQLEAQDLRIDQIFFASSSGGTQAGMILGKALLNLGAELCPIAIDKEELNGKRLEEVVLELVLEGAKALDLKQSFSENDTRLIRDYDHAGYGMVTREESGAIRLLAQKEGILLDPVYTGRAFYGMLDRLWKGRMPQNSNILFWHTGGIPALLFQDFSDRI
jgi:D-cysteine desulfhydrase